MEFTGSPSTEVRCPLEPDGHDCVAADGWQLWSCYLSEPQDFVWYHRQSGRVASFSLFQPEFESRRGSGGSASRISTREPRRRREEEMFAIGDYYDYYYYYYYCCYYYYYYDYYYYYYSYYHYQYY